MDKLCVVSIILTLVSLAAAGPSGLSCYKCDGNAVHNDCLSQVERCAPKQQACLMYTAKDRVVTGCASPALCDSKAKKGCTEDGCYSCCTEDRCNLVESRNFQRGVYPCFSNPCQNNGFCINECAGYRCECNDGYTGQNCEIAGPVTCYNHTHCVPNCDKMPDGHYQSCNSCDVYISCSGHVTYDNRLCPIGLVWDDNVKRCECYSATCSCTS